MKQFDYVIKDALGIHARPAGALVKEAKTFADSELTITNNTKGITAKLTQLMKVMALGVKCGDTVTITVEGGDEEAVADKLKKFFEDNF